MGNFFKNLIGVDNKKINISNEGNLEDLNYEEETLEKIDKTNDEINEDKEDEWLDDDYEEGQLSIDVYQTPENIVVKSTIAGVDPEDIDISINNDMLTIRGKRESKETIKEDDYLYRECYWGSFSRSIILPVEVKANGIEATLENGILTITLPKSKTTRQISVKVKEK